MENRPIDQFPVPGFLFPLFHFSRSALVNLYYLAADNFKEREEAS